jgi:hypothetical protein
VVDVDFLSKSEKWWPIRECGEKQTGWPSKRAIVYCAEWPDAEDGRALDLLFDATAELKPSVDNGFYGGVTVIETQARRVSNPRCPPDRSSSYLLPLGQPWQGK